jgi:hypothetical protein
MFKKAGANRYSPEHIRINFMFFCFQVINRR